jgi:undecaprenyl-diphosphatase
MTILQAIVLGIVEGATEFLPISSTFHLIFTSQILGIEQTEFVKLFEVFIQSGAILSVLILYAKELIQNKHLAVKVIVAFIPTALIGLAMYDIIKDVFFESEVLMLSMFVLIGLVFFLVEYLIKNGKLSISQHVTMLTYRHAIYIGLFQAMAIVPGVSRAGAVIIGMMILGYKRDEAAKFSFMLSIPTIFAASFLDLIQSRDILMAQTDMIGILAVGSITAFITSLIIIKWFIGFLQTNTLNLFGWYRIFAAIILILVMAIS